MSFRWAFFLVVWLTVFSVLTHIQGSKTACLLPISALSLIVPQWIMSYIMNLRFQERRTLSMMRVLSFSLIKMIVCASILALLIIYFKHGMMSVFLGMVMGLWGLFLLSHLNWRV